MLLDLIYGGVGSGKTERCIELIERTLAKNPGHNAILTVPDQYSYTAEKRLVERLGGTGLNGVEVLTFSQFFRRYVKQDKNYLTPAGKQMLCYRAVEAQKKNGGIFARSAEKPGFIGKVSELVSEMKRYLISPDDLRGAAKEEESMLSQKLLSFSDIYEAYNSMTEQGFADSDDDFASFALFINESGEFKNTHIWFDGFSDFLPQHYEVIRAFLVNAQSVHVTLSMPYEADEDGVFQTAYSTLKRLKGICDEVGARLYEQSCGTACRTVKSPELLHLMENWDNRKNIYSGTVENISLFCARDLYSETEYVAKKILAEVQKGARFRDIGVMCTDMQQYSHLIEALFNDYKIPYFSDTDQPVTDHPVILTVLAAFDISEENWSYESVFRLLRTGFVYIEDDGGVHAIDAELLDRLENYVLRYGIRGKKAWLSEEDWEDGTSGVFDAVLGERKHADVGIEEINAIRRKITAPFEGFYEKTSGKRTVRELAEALYEFLCGIHLYEGLGIEIQRLNECGRRNEAERMKEIWNLLMEVINQAAVTFGDETVGKKSFREMMRAGLSKAVMQIIPSGIDSVAVGEADRNSPARLDIIFFMGAVGGTMPSQISGDGILTDSDRITLAGLGVETAKDSQKKSEQEMFKFYRSVTSASKKLYFSYPTSDSEGQAKQPAAFIRDLYKMFPKMKISDDLIESDGKIVTEKQAYLYIMRSVADKQLRKRARIIAEHFKNNADFAEKLGMAKYAAVYRSEQPKITRESAELLYGGYHRYSVSRLNDYSACPFGYFVRHGLKAQEQETWQIQKFEIGSLLHWAVCQYCHDVEDGAESFEDAAQKWRALSVEDSDKLIDKIMADISDRTLSRLRRNKGKVEYLLERMKKILRRSVEIVRLSLSMGEYTAVCYEQKFCIDIEWNGKSVGLDGIIDRVDAAKKIESGEISLRVIDYKSGSKAFDVVSVSNSTDMQLVVYAIAATELYKKGALGRAGRGLVPSVSGILYNKLRNDIVSCKENETGRIDEILKNKMKLDGLVVSGEDETETAVEMDRSLNSGGKKSEFMKLAFNSKGDSLDKRFSAVTSREKFDILTSYVKKSAVRLDDEIFEGKIGIEPSDGKTGRACTYCKYKEICLYDARAYGIRKQIEKEDAAWTYMEKETAEGGDGSGGESMDR